MDGAKLALETLVVGLFGLVWILVLVDMLRPEERLFSSILERFRESSGATSLIGLLVLPVAYIIGSVEFPLADRLFNQDNRFGVDLPLIESDDDIKVETYLRKDGWVSLSRVHPCLQRDVDVLATNAARFRGGTTEQTLKDSREVVRAVRALYDYQKFAVLQDESGYRLLKPLYDQVVILRGTAFNAILLAGVCLLGLGLARRRMESPMPGRYYVLLPTALIAWAASVYGLMEAEREYDKHIVGAFYAMRPAGEVVPPGEPVACPSDAAARLTMSRSD